MTIYRTKEEAEVGERMLRREFISRFCPVIRSGCRADCACFEDVVIATPSTDRFPIYGPTCKHPFIEGYMVVNVEE